MSAITQDQSYAKRTNIHKTQIESEFAMIPNKTCRSKDISRNAKGLLMELLSLPADWDIHTWHLAETYTGKKKGNGIKATRSQMKELIEFGYVTYKKFKNALGQWQHNYEVFPEPVNKIKEISPHCLERNLPELPADKGHILQRKESTKTDLTKKESIRSIKGQPVHKSPNVNKSVHKSDPISSPKPDPLPDPIPVRTDTIPFPSGLFSMERPSELEMEELLEILELEPEYENDLNPSTVSRWVNKYKPGIVLANIKLLFQTKKAQKNPIRNPEAWMESALKKDYAKVREWEKINTAYALKIQRQKGLTNLKLKDRYCMDTETGKDFYFNLPCDTFKQVLSYLLE